MMELEHFQLQFKRLERHYRSAKADKDPISFLDLAHCLRIWVDMKGEADKLIVRRGTHVTFKNTAYSRKLKDILKSSSFTYVPISSGVDSPDVEVKGLIKFDRLLTAEEGTKLYEMGPPSARATDLTFSQWLSAEIIETATEVNQIRERLGISREILIKRVANMLGASHPQEMEEFQNLSNRFDPHIKKLHQIEVANGYPLTYYQIIEIAGDILESLKGMLDS